MSTFEGVEKEITKMSHSLGPDLIEFLSSHLFEKGSIIELDRTLSVDVVLDTNILFEAVRGKMLQGSCFLEKILSNPMVNFIAPEDLKTEILDVIPRKFVKQKKTKDLDLEFAKNLALEFMNSVTIVKDIKEEFIEQAYNLIGDRDPKDVNFLALHLQYSTQAIVAKDKDYDDADVQVWKLADVGKVVTIVANGRISLCLSNFIGPHLYVGIFEVLQAVAIRFFKTLKTLGVHIINGVSNNLGLTAFVLAFAWLIEKDTQLISKKFKDMKVKLREFVDKLLSFGEALGVSLVTLLEVSDALKTLTLNANDEISSLQRS